MSKTQHYVYILTNKSNKVLYTGVTNDLVRRMYEHRNHLDPGGFTAKYNVTKLIHYELTNDVYAALQREKQIKSWNRMKKDQLVSEANPMWEDLYPSILY